MSFIVYSVLSLKMRIKILQKYRINYNNKNEILVIKSIRLIFHFVYRFVVVVVNCMQSSKQTELLFFFSVQIY